MIGPHRLRRKLDEKQTVVGIMANFNSSWFVEMAALIGFDYILIDCEHGPMSPESLELMIRTAEQASISPLVRIPSNQPEHFLRFMDIGAVGVQVPGINSKAEAEAAAAAIRYHPRGNRGLTSNTRAGHRGYGMSIKELVETTNREAVLFLMIESEEGVNNIDDIIAVPGVDGIVVGLMGLSQSMGLTGETSHPAIQKASEHIVARCKARGMPVTDKGGDRSAMRASIERGGEIIEMGASSFIVKAGRAALSQISTMAKS